MDAVAGAIAASLSVILLYPVELQRVKVQTQTHSSSETYDEIIRGIVKRVLDDPSGLGMRISHTLISSFLYYKLHGTLHNMTTSFLKASSEKRQSSYMLGNALSMNLAAIAVVILTTPLERLTIRQQAGTHDANATKSKSILSLWEGLTPAILLCSNPTIHYSIYDIIKFYILRLRQKVK